MSEGHRNQVVAYLGLGSNLGDRERNIRRALGLLSQKLRLVKVSSLYETEPWGYKEQPRFINCAAAFATDLGLDALLGFLQQVEQALGRKPTFQWGPRVIDIDILLFGDRVVHTEHLEVPHPMLPERAFALVPLAEIAADIRHPVLGLTVREMADRVSGKEGVQRLAPPPEITGAGPGRPGPTAGQ